MKRRNNGAGHIRQKPDGRWEALYYVNGERRYITGRKGESAADVQRRLNEALHNLDRGIETPRDNRQTFGEYLDAWLVTKKPSVEYSYWKRCETVIRLYVKPSLGKVPLTKVTAQQIQQVYAHVIGLGKAPKTVEKIHIALHKALEDAMRLDLVVRNVADLVDKPKDTNPSEMKTYTPVQLNQLFAAAQGDPLEALYILLPTTGCRLGELLGLRWEVLDLDRGEMHITAAMKDVGGRQWLGTPKTPRSRRIVPLTAMAVEALRRHRVTQTVERLKHGADWNPHHLVFCTSHGTPFSQTNFRKEYYMPFLEKAGLPHLKAHNAGRHTNASIQLSSGEQVHVVSSWLGHANPSTTLNIYAHLMPGAKEGARDRLERTLAANPEKKA